MGESDAKRKLVEFLERRAFRPVLDADPEKVSGAKREKLMDVQRRTETEIERFHGYSSADDVVTNFRRDLNSEPARRVHRELSALGLPTINDVREEFEALAAKLGVR
jgi:hypothetical protein